MHAFSLVLIAFIRPYLFKLLNPKEQEADEIMDINYHGFTWFVIYLAILTFIHHLVYFKIEKRGTMNACVRGETHWHADIK